MSVTGPSHADQQRDGKYDDLNAAMAKCCFGRHELPVPLIQSPEEKYRARVARQDNVDTLERSLLQFGTINEHVEVVLFVGPNRPLPTKVGFKPPLTLEEMKSRGLEGFFTVVGDHTQKAMNQLARKFENNPKWAKLSAVVYVCQRNNDSYAALKSWGILDNIKGEKRVTVSFLDKIAALHEDYLALAEHEGEAGHKERTALRKEQRRQDFGGISSGQMMQLWSLAARKGRVWELLHKIVSGDMVHSQDRSSTSKARKGGRKGGAKEVKSAANFVNIGGIDDTILEEMLQAIVVGHASLQRLNEQCGLVKARMRLQTAVLQDSNVDEEDWEAAKVKFPLSTHEDFVERWACSLVRQGLKARDSLPELFFFELDRRIQSDKSSAEVRGRAAAAQVH